MLYCKGWGDQEEARSQEHKMGMRSISDEAQGRGEKTKQNRIKDQVKMAATGERV